jgi:lambda repressor-like predicted transcriptional regulator
MTQPLSLGEQPHDPTGCHAGGRPHLGPCMADGVPGRQHLTGYRITGYDHLIAALGRSRESQGISLRALAERTDCSAATLSENLRGRHRMDAVTALQIAAALGYDLALIDQEGA